MIYIKILILNAYKPVQATIFKMFSIFLDKSISKIRVILHFQIFILGIQNVIR